MYSIDTYYRDHNAVTFKSLEPKVVYYAYKEGVCKEFDSHTDATQFSKIIEKVVSNKTDMVEARRQFNIRKNEAIAEWKRDLEDLVRSSYIPSMTTIQFEALLLTATNIDDGKEDYDHIAELVEDIAQLIANNFKPSEQQS